VNAGTFRSWQSIQQEVLRRIHAREWEPGEVIPNEADLAREFGCARATVNRALQALAESGLLERRRKAGTRVALHPVSKATVNVPVIRLEIEERGRSYGYERITRRESAPAPLWAAAAMGLAAGTPLLHVAALHTADGAPFVHEDRWINTDTVPGAAQQDFCDVSANEWLLTNAPYTHGDICFAAMAANGEPALRLDAPDGGPLFVIERTTWDGPRAITAVRLSYAPGHSIRTTI